MEKLEKSEQFIAVNKNMSKNNLFLVKLEINLPTERARKNDKK